MSFIFIKYKIYYIPNLMVKVKIYLSDLEKSLYNFHRAVEKKVGLV